MDSIREDMQARHSEFWEMRNLVQSLPDEEDSSEGAAKDEGGDDAERKCPLADELIGILLRAHRAYFLAGVRDAGVWKPGSGTLTTSGKTVTGKRTKFKVVTKDPTTGKVTGKDEVHKGDAITVTNESTLEKETRTVDYVKSDVEMELTEPFASDVVTDSDFTVTGTGDEAKRQKLRDCATNTEENWSDGWWKKEDWRLWGGKKFWPQEAGINTIDPTFGWNIAMHCAALGKKRTLQRLIKFRYLKKDVAADSKDNIDIMKWAVPLNLGHKSSRNFDLHNVSEDSLSQQGGYVGVKGWNNERALREFFDLATVAGERDDLLDEHRFGYWSKRDKKEGSEYKPVLYPRLSTVLTICHYVGENEMKETVQAAMKKSKKERGRGDRLAALSDFSTAMDYTDEASSKYKEVMAKENMFVDAAVAMIESHLNFIPPRELHVPKTTPIEYKNVYDDAEIEDDLQPWESTTLEEIIELESTTLTPEQYLAKLAKDNKSTTLILDGKKKIQSNTLVRVAPGESWTKNTIFEPQQGKEKTYAEIKNQLVASEHIDESLTKHYNEAMQAFNRWRSIDPNLLSVGVEVVGPLFMSAVKHAVRDKGGKGLIRLNELEIAAVMLETLGPIQADSGKIHQNRFDLIDFTLQDENGRTLKWLCRHISERPDGWKTAEQDSDPDCWNRSLSTMESTSCSSRTSGNRPKPRPRWILSA